MKHFSSLLFRVYPDADLRVCPYAVKAAVALPPAWIRVGDR